MSDSILDAASAQEITTGQRLFLRYFTAILIDLVVLNLFAEFWDLVTVESFSISLLAAVLLQVLLKLTLAIEHRIGAYFKAKEGAMAKFLRIFCAWLILFGSKFVILFAVDVAFGDAIVFGGPLHGVVSFIAVVFAMLIAEELIVRFYQRLG